MRQQDVAGRRNQRSEGIRHDAGGRVRSRTRDEVRSDVSDYIEAFYNRKRRHKHIGGVSPVELKRAVASKKVSTEVWGFQLANHERQDFIIEIAGK